MLMPIIILSAAWRTQAAKSSNGIPATAGLYTVRVALNSPEVVIVVVAFTMVFIESSSAMLI